MIKSVFARFAGELPREIESLSDRKLKLLKELPVYLLIFVYLMVLLYTTLGYSPRARLIPLLVIIPASMITLVYIAMLLSPKLQAIGRRYSPTIIGTNELLMEKEEKSATQSPLNADSLLVVKNSLYIGGIFVLVPVIVQLVGLVLGAFIIVTVLDYTISKKSKGRSVTIGFVLALVTYVLFIEIIGVIPIDPILFSLL